MARAKMPGLQLRGGIWWIWKQIDGYGRIRQSTGYGKDEYEKAEHFLIKRLNEIRDAQRFGIRPERVFRVAAAKFLMEHRHLSTIGDIAITFKQVDPWIGHLPLKSIHDGTLAPLVAEWRTRGSKCHRRPAWPASGMGLSPRGRAPSQNDSTSLASRMVSRGRKMARTQARTRAIRLCERARTRFKAHVRPSS
jgi:hypothetical protein